MLCICANGNRNKITLVNKVGVSKQSAHNNLELVNFLGLRFVCGRHMRNHFEQDPIQVTLRACI